jgi:hypothetical protein
MNRYFLCEGVHLCRLGDGIVLLNLRTNQYVGVGAEDVAAFERSVAGFSLSAESVRSDEVTESEVIADLRRRRFLTRSRSSGRPATLLAPSATRAIPYTPERSAACAIKLRHIARFAAAVLNVVIHLRTSRLHGLIASYRKRAGLSARRNSSPSLEEVCDLLAVFRRLRVWAYTAHDVCLFDALVLTDYLLRFGYDAAFFIGVSSKPFAAHAWVQYSSWVLDDPLEDIQSYVPILATSESFPCSVTSP